MLYRDETRGGDVILAIGFFVARLMRTGGWYRVRFDPQLFGMGPSMYLHPENHMALELPRKLG